MWAEPGLVSLRNKSALDLDGLTHADFCWFTSSFRMIRKPSLALSLRASSGWTSKGDVLAVSSSRDRGKLNDRCCAIGSLRLKCDGIAQSYGKRSQVKIMSISRQGSYMNQGFAAAVCRGSTLSTHWTSRPISCNSTDP